MPVNTKSSRLDTIAMYLAKIAIFVLVPLFGLWMYYQATFTGLSNPDAMDTAQIARHLSEGDGFSTSLIRPFATVVWKSHITKSMPDLTHPPLFPLSTAILLVVAEARDAIIGFSSCIWYVLTIPMVYLLGIRLFDRKIALIACIFYLSCERLLQYALSGMPSTMTMFLFTCFLLFICKAQTEDETGQRINNGKMFFLAGSAAGLCYLSDYMYIAIIPVALIFIMVTARKESRKLVLVFLIGFTILALPWMVRNQKLTGHPVFGLKAYESVMYTRLHPGYSMYRDATPRSLSATFADSVPEIVRKFSNGFSDTIRQSLLVPSVLITVLFIVAIPFRLGNERTQAMRNLIYGTLFVTLLFSILFKASLEILVPFSPFIILIAVAFVYHVMEISGKKKWYQTAALIVITVLIAYPTINTITNKVQNPVDEEISFFMSDVPKFIPASMGVVSDVPWKLAWYSNRLAVWLPKNDGFISSGKSVDVDVVILTSSLMYYPKYEKVNDWQQVFVRGESWSEDFLLMTDPRAPIRVFGRIDAFKEIQRDENS